MKLLGKGGNKMYGFRLVACLFALATPFWANAQSQCSFNYDLTFEKYGNLYGSPAQALQAAKFTYFGPSGTYIQLPDLRTPPYLGSYYSLELSLLAAGGSGTISILDYGTRSLADFPVGWHFLMKRGIRNLFDANLNVINTQTDYYSDGYILICTEQTAQPQITLTGVAEGNPRGTSNWRELALTARVTVNGAPVAGKGVTYKLTAKAGPDGHNHGNLSAKPVGFIVAGVTNAGGELKSAYIPSEFSGIYTVEASCDSCSNKATLDVAVRVPDLVELTADTDSPPAYTLVGETSAHTKNHFFTVHGREALRQLIDRMRVLEWLNPGINDGSIAWGGRFDIGAGWGGSHAGHREGEEVDISFLRPSSIGPDLRQKTFDDLKKGNLRESPQVLWHQFDNADTGSKAHFHVYLLGQKASSITKY